LHAEISIPNVLSLQGGNGARQVVRGVDETAAQIGREFMKGERTEEFHHRGEHLGTEKHRKDAHVTV
jgi:hypothetical protein